MKINSIQVETPTSDSTVVGSQADGTTAVFTIQSIREGVIKKYRGLISQESGFAPELIEISNTLESPIVTSHFSEGVYRLTCADFLNNKTFWTITPTPTTALAASFITVVHKNDNQTLEIRTFYEDGTLADEVLNNAAIGIEIY
jgi:hypothetical protein